jgi:hypothetical protein
MVVIRMEDNFLCNGVCVTKFSSQDKAILLRVRSVGGVGRSKETIGAENQRNLDHSTIKI